MPWTPVIDDKSGRPRVNDRAQLATLGRVLNDRICDRHMRASVTIVDPASTWIDVTSPSAQDTTILPGANCSRHLDRPAGHDQAGGDHPGQQRSAIGRTCAGPRSTPRSSQPTPPSALQLSARRGPNWAKAARSAVSSPRTPRSGPGQVPAHLTYCGDATIGAGANIGAGTIFANFDGVRKHRTVIGAQSFVGSDSVLIAPVTVGDGAYVAAEVGADP